MDIEQINELIDALKMILAKGTNINIPPPRDGNKIELKSSKYTFTVDLNRKGHLKPKVTFQLRENQHKDFPLLRLDLIGRSHTNPPGEFPYANIRIPCPHLHIAHPEHGTSIAYPLDSEYAKMVLNDKDMENLVLVLKGFLKRCNVSNINDYSFSEQSSLF